MDPSKRPTVRMKRVEPRDEQTVVKIAPAPRQKRGTVLEEVVVVDEKDPRREHG